MQLKGSVLEKWKGIKANIESNLMVIATSFTSIWENEKMIKHDSYQRTQCQYKVTLFHSDRK